MPFSDHEHLTERHITDVCSGRYGFETKTDAVHFALNELDRRARLKAVLEGGMGMTADELKASVCEGYDLESLRVAEAPDSPEA